MQFSALSVCGGVGSTKLFLFVLRERPPFISIDGSFQFISLTVRPPRAVNRGENKIISARDLFTSRLNTS